MAFTQVTIVQDYTLADGTEPSGTVTFTPTAPMFNGGLVIPRTPAVARLAGGVGTINVTLVANTDPATTPAGVYYRVEEVINGILRVFNIQIPHNLGSQITLYTLTQVASPPGISFPSSGAVGALLIASNLSDLASASTARTNLGLHGAAILDVGTTAGTVAAGDDPRIAAAALKSANLSDLASAATARTNLGLHGAAVLDVGTTAGTVAAGDDTRIAGAALKSANLSDLASASTARTNLGLAAIAASGSATDLSTGTVPTARLGTGAASSSTFLRGDQTWTTVAGGGGSVSNTPSGVYNVKVDYGAIGDGSVNDATAIQNAINACGSAGGGVVYFPPGTYLVSSTLTVTNGRVILEGAGMGSTTITKSGNFTLLQIKGTAGTPNTHIGSCGVRRLMLDGGNHTGTLLDLVYGTRHIFTDLHLYNNNDIGIDIVELWDCRFTNVYVELASGTSATQPGIYVRSSRASSGFGSSTDSSNQLYFVGCLVEVWRGGAIRVEQGTGSPQNIYSIHFYATKIETGNVRGSAIVVGTGASNVTFTDTYIYMDAFDSGYSTAVDAIALGGNEQNKLDGCYIGVGTAVLTRGVNVSAGGATLINVEGFYDAGAPTSGNHVEVTGGSNFSFGHIRSSNATALIAGISTSQQANPGQPIRAVAGVVSDASFPAVPPIGTLAVDTTNNKIYVRTGSGTWKSVTVA